MGETNRLSEYNYITQVQKDTRLRLAEYIIEETGLEVEQIDVYNPDTIPEHTEWLYREGNRMNILPNLSIELDRHEDTIRRRMNDYEKDKQVEVLREPHADIEGQYTPTNIRLLKPGIGYVLETVTEMRIREQLLSENAVSRLEQMVKECADMASLLGMQDTALIFDARYEYKSPFEFSKDEFRDEMKFIRSNHKQLKAQINMNRANHVRTTS